MAKTDDIEKMRAAVAAADKAAEEAKAQAALEFIKPLGDLVASVAYQTVLKTLTELAPAYKDELFLQVHIDAIRNGLTNLSTEIDRRSPKA